MSRDAEIGKRIAALRAVADLSQGQLAEALGVAQQTIAKIEKGSRPLKYTEAVTICSFLGVPVSALSESPTEFDELASLIAQTVAVAHIQNGVMEELAGALGLRLFLLALLLSSNRGKATRPEGWDELERKAQVLLQKDWGEVLNNDLTAEIKNQLIYARDDVETKGRDYRELLNDVAGNGSET